MNEVWYLGERIYVMGPAEDGWVWCLWPNTRGKRKMFRHWVDQLEVQV